MEARQMWAEYKEVNPAIGEEIDSWAFGVEADTLADLVLQGIKTATTSAYELYQVEGEELPQVGSFDVILDSKNQAVCIIEITNVLQLPFNQVTAEHAYKEGEGDRSLAYWKSIHKKLFSQWLGEAGLEFTDGCKVVLEEFRKVYPLD